MIPIERIRKAQPLLTRYLPRTPLIESPPIAAMLGTRTFLKLETCSPVGSFKTRGAFVAISEWLKSAGGETRSPRRRPRIVTASSGNHGMAVAYAARILGADATVYISEHASPTKIEAIRGQGAAIVRTGRDFDEAKEAGKAYATEGGGWWLEDGKNPDVAVGTGTIGLEIVEDLPEVDEILVPVGSGALIGGIGSAVRSSGADTEITGVQPESAPAMVRSFAAGKPVPTDSCETIADGLASRVPVPKALELMREVTNRMVEVSEEAITFSVRALVEWAHLLAEPASAAALAGALERREELVGKNVVLVITGANIDRAVLLHCLGATSSV